MNAHAIEGRRMGKVKRCSETGLMIPECRLAAKVESVERDRGV